jgi:hypothetical protein
MCSFFDAGQYSTGIGPTATGRRMARIMAGIAEAGGMN